MGSTSGIRVHAYHYTEMKPLPVIEIFGPVIQGEGVMAGHQTHFLRLGGCDFRCVWCDTPYAVLPEQVKVNSTQTDVGEIVARLTQLAEESGCYTVTLSGGNPAIHQLDPLIRCLNNDGWKVVVETQGSIYASWFLDCELVVLSPKPPSSEMAFDRQKFLDIIRPIRLAGREICFKVVVFTQEDFDFALGVFHNVYDPGLGDTYYLQPGTDIASPSESATRDTLAAQTQMVHEWMRRQRYFPYVRILPQIHTMVYGTRRGV